MNENNEQKGNKYKLQIITFLMLILAIGLYIYFNKSHLVHKDITLRKAQITAPPLETYALPQKISTSNNQLIELGANLIIREKMGDDFTDILDQISNITDDEFIIARYKSLLLLSDNNISDVRLFDKLNQIHMNLIASKGTINYYFTNKLLGEILEKLITIKIIDQEKESTNINQIIKAKRFLLDNNLAQAITTLEPLDNEQISDFVVSAKYKQQISNYILETYNHIVRLK